jgi:electron transport complex protein RnfC
MSVISFMQSTEISDARFASLWPADLPEIKSIRPGQLLIPLSHRGGGTAEPVRPGTHVAAGEKIVIRDDELSYVPLAPLSGVVGYLREAWLTTGRSVSGVDLTPDEVQKNPPPPKPPEGEDSNLVALIDRLRQGGVGADRTASPDLLAQLNLAVQLGARRVICTVLDSDAGLRLSSLLAAMHAERMIRAVVRLRQITGATEAQLAIEAFAATLWTEPIRKAAQKADVQIVELANDYPQSDPTLIHYTLTGGRLRPGMSPTTQGVVLLDAAAAVAVGELLEGRPALFASVGVNNHLLHQKHFVSVPVGTSIRELLTALQIPAEGVTLRGGELLRDIRLTPDTVIACGELTIHVSPPEIVRAPQPCVRCGWCLEACPTRVQPAGILEAAQRGDHFMADRAGIHACIECGLCSHVCPSRLPLLDAVRWWRTLDLDAERRR